MSKKLSQLLPIDEVGEDFIVTNYDTITYGYKFDMPEVYTMGQLEAQSFFDAYRSALKKLGMNVVVQKYGMFFETPYESDYKGESDTRFWNERKYDGRPVMNVHHFIFVSFYFGNKSLVPLRSPFKTKFRSIRDRRYHKLRKSELDEYGKMLNSFEVTMGGAGHDGDSGICRNFKRMDSNEIFAFLERYLSCDYSDKGVKDFASYDLRDGLQIGSREVSVLSMRRMPTMVNGFSVGKGVVQEGSKYNEKSTYTSDVKLRTSFLFPLGMGLPIEHIICETMVILHNEKVESVLKAEQSELRFFTGLGNHAAIDKVAQITDFIAATANHDLTMCKYGLTIIFPHRKEEKIKLTNSLIDIASGVCGMSLYCENRGDLKSYFGNLPGCGHSISDLGFGWLETMCMSTHLESYKNGNRDGIQLVDVFGKPFLFDFWDEKNKYLKARNGVLFAPTGEGKSFLVCNLLDQAHALGDEICIIDVDGSYKRITQLRGGIYYDSKNLKTFAFNPFRMAYYNEENGKWYVNKNALGTEDDVMLVEFLSTLILSIWFRNTPGIEIPVQTKELLKGAIKSFYEYVNTRENGEKIVMNFNSFYRFVMDVYSEELKAKDINKSSFDVQQFGIMCLSFTIEGDYGFLLNAENHVQLDNSWVCFDLVSIKDLPDINGVVTLIVMNLVQTKLDLLKGRRLRFFIDEAVDFIRGGMFGEYIGGLYRKIRKRGGQVFIITQSIRFLVEGMDDLVKSSIFANTSIKILLNHSSDKDSYPLLQQMLSLTDSEMKLVKQLSVDKARPYRLVFMKFGEMPGFIFRNEVARETFAAYNTDAEKVKEINEIAVRTGSLKVGIETFVENEEERSREGESK